MRSGTPVKSSRKKGPSQSSPCRKLIYSVTNVSSTSMSVRTHDSQDFPSCTVGKIIKIVDSPNRLGFRRRVTETPGLSSSRSLSICLNCGTARIHTVGKGGAEKAPHIPSIHLFMHLSLDWHGNRISIRCLMFPHSLNLSLSSYVGISCELSIPIHTRLKRNFFDVGRENVCCFS